MKIFGREPALWLGLIGAVLTTLVSLNQPWLSAGAAAAILAGLTAVTTAVLTRPVAPGLFVAAFTAIAALFAEYGTNLPPALVTGISSVILAGFALAGIRPQVSPAEPNAPVRQA